jgi:hypothetical protein
MFIKKIHFHLLQNEEHAGYHTYVSEYITEDGNANSRLISQMSDHNLKLGIEKSVLDLIQKNSYTQRVNEADQVRDKPIRGFFKVVKGLLDHFNPAMAQAAYKVNLINENFSGITRLSNDKQTQAFDSYIAAIDDASADITALALMDWVTEMKATHAAFLEVVKNRNTENDDKPNISMKEARMETDVAYNALVDRINAFITIEGDALFAPLVTKINGRIDQYTTAIAQRKGIAEAKKKKDTTTDTETK